jgi:hypothetical protein
MKSLYILATCLVAFISFPTAYAQNVSREKKFSGRFPADKGKLVIDNRYGKLDINTWDKNEVTVEITVTAKAKSPEKAEDLLDRVSIKEPDKGAGIYYKTVIEKSVVTNGEFKIDYVINMPRRQTATFINKYGDINISDVDGKLDIDLAYGNLQTASIKGSDNDIKVRFGSATINSIEAGTISSSYSRLSIDKAGNLDVSNQFANTVIGTARSVDIEQKYGDFKIGAVNQLKGTVQYAGLSVDKLLKNTQITLKYCSTAKFNYVGPDVNNVDVTSGFSNISFHFDNAASLSADLSVSFGNAHNNASNISLTAYDNSSFGNTSKYKMKVGTGRGNMTLKMEYGNVVFK